MLLMLAFASHLMRGLLSCSGCSVFFVCLFFGGVHHLFSDLSSIQLLQVGCLEQLLVEMHGGKKGKTVY